MADIDQVMARLRSVADAALQPTAPAVAAPLAVQVTSLPARRPWIFRISRDAEGKVETVLAEPWP